MRSERSSESRVIARSESDPSSVTVRTGKRERLTSCAVGASASAGSSGSTSSTARRTSSSASSMSWSDQNSITTEPPPTRAEEVISLMPSMPARRFSSGRTSRRSESPGEMPACESTT